MEEPARAAVLCLSALTLLARANVLGDAAILANPEGKAAYQRSGLGPSKMSS